MEEKRPNERLREARIAQGWTLADVAKALGASPLTVGRWERGEAFPGPYYRQKLSKLFDMPLDALGLDPVKNKRAGFVKKQKAAPPDLRIWSVPYLRNPFFTGREEILKQLHATLRASRTAALTQPQAISGLGGIGKTQTALEYCYRYRDEYPSIIWMKATSGETLAIGFLALAKQLKLPEATAKGQNTDGALKDRMIVVAVKRWFETQPGWLLVFDNADDPTILSDFLPSPENGHILITTRASALGPFAQSIRLENMTADEGALLLLRRAKILSPEHSPDTLPGEVYANAAEFSKAVDGLPLALDQAGAYIEGTSQSIADYVKVYQKRGIDLLKQPDRLSPDYPESVASTWLLSFQKIEQTNVAAAQLLSFCAFLDPDAIPEAIITEGATKFGPVLQEAASDPLQLNAAIEELLRYSLLQRDPSTRSLTIHRLVQAVLKSRMDRETQLQWITHAIQAVSQVYPIPDVTTWSRCKQYLPHVLVCLTYLENWQIVNAEGIELLIKAGQYFWQHGEYKQAGDLCEKAFTLAEQHFGPTHQQARKSLDLLVEIYYTQGNYGRAMQACKKLLVLCKKTLDKDHEATADALHNLASLYHVQGQYQRAERLYLQAFAMRKRLFASPHPALATNLNTLAGLYEDQGEAYYEKAEAYYLQARRMYEETLPAEHPDLITSLNNLAGFYFRKGQYAESKKLLVEALERREKSLGPDHPETATHLNNLGKLFFAQGDERQAERLYRKALSIYIEALGPVHHYVAGTLKNLGQLYEKQGRNEEAEDYYERSISSLEQALGPDHPAVLFAIEQYATFLRTVGKIEKAEEIEKRLSNIS